VDIVVFVFALAIILIGAELFTNGIEWFGHRLNLGEGAIGSVLAAVATALPETLIPVIAIIGPILAIGVAGTQMVTDPDVEGEYRAYDREEELAADRYGQDLLELVIGRVRACQAEMALLERLVQARTSRPWAAWLSTHPRPADRLKDAQEHCPA